MINVPLNEVQDDLSRYLSLAETEDVVITRQGEPAGLLIGFDGPESCWDERLVRRPKFQERIARARDHLRAGQGLSMEQMRAKYGLPPTV